MREKAQAEGKRHLRLALLHALLAEYHFAGDEAAARAAQNAADALRAHATPLAWRRLPCGHTAALGAADDEACTTCEDQNEARAIHAELDARERVV